MTPVMPFRSLRSVLVSGGLSLTLTAGLALPAHAQEDTDPGLRAKWFGLSMEPQSDLDFDTTSGFGVGLEYRMSPRLGVEVTAFSSQLKTEFQADFFDEFEIKATSRLRMTPVLAQLDIHLTPGHKLDLHLGPVVGWSLYGDFETTVRTQEGGEVTVEKDKFGVKDAFTWGAHLDLDVPLGRRGAFLTAGLTYLKTRLEEADSEPGVDARLDLDPLVARLGIGYRF